MSYSKIKIAWFGKHFGEEPPFVGNEKQGSGAIFFSGCNLRCVFCQNYQISQEMMGTDYSIEELADIMIKLQDDGAVNINLVTPNIWWRQIKNALLIADENGLKIPIAWNSNGYDNIEILRGMDGLIDIYLPDFKYGIDEVGLKYSGVKNYSQIAIAAVKEMLAQVGNLEVGDKDIAAKGVIVRHLILPNNLENSFAVLEKIAEIDGNTHISLMRQYLPMHKAPLYHEIARTVSDEEVEKVYAALRQLGFSNGWVQEGKCEDIFVPDFRKEEPFGK